MTLSLPVLIVALPSVSAVILALVPYWRIGMWVNAAAATLLFVAACLLAWYPRQRASLLVAGTPETILTLLTSLVAMTTTWLRFRSVAPVLVQRQIDSGCARIYHAAYQTFIATLLGALLSDSWPLTWVMLVASMAAGMVLTGLPLTVTALAAAWRMLLQCGAALMLMLLGMLAVQMAAELNGVALRWSALTAVHYSSSAAWDLACILLILGCGIVAGMVLLHSWLPDAEAVAAAPGAVLLNALLVNVPLLIILRVRTVTATSISVTILLLALGLAALLLAACAVSPRMDARRMMAFIGFSQIGLIMFAFGLGTPAMLFAGVLLMTLFSLARASVLQCQDMAPTRITRWTCAASSGVLTALPLYALLLIAGATMDYAPWLTVPLAGGVILVTWVLVGWTAVLRLPAAAPKSGSDIHEALAVTPIWLQLAITVFLALAMPGAMTVWFQIVAGAH